MNLPSGYNGKLYNLLEEVHKLKFSEPQKALELANFVYVQALKSADEVLEANCLYVLGVCHEISSSYPQAMKFLSEAIKLAQQLGEKKIMGDALNYVGVIHDNLNNYSNALKAYFRALKIYEDVKENKKTAIVLSNIGLIYTNIKDYRNALKFYSHALDIAEEENDAESLLITNINIGLTHSQLGNFEEALKFLYDAFDQATNSNDKRRASLALDHIADTNIKLNKTGEAFRLFEESRKLKLELEDKRGLVKVYSTLGHMHLLENNMTEAKANLEKALELATELGIKRSVHELHKMLSDAYERIEDSAKALYHLKIAYRKELELLKEEAEIRARNISTQLEIEQAQKEAEIQRLKNIELAQALEDVKKLNVNLKELNDEKNEFMAIAVHDLKNPLQNILSTARILKRSSELPKSEMDEFTANIINQTDRMFNIIKKLLDHNAIDQGELKLKITNFDVNSLAEEIVSNFKEESERKKLNLMLRKAPEEVSINTDKVILYEILQNLVSNAIKFSTEFKNIILSVYADEKNIKLEVADQGPGFSDEDKRKMFSKFARLSAKPTGDEHSTGLGLSIVKKLCELIGATLKLESKKDEGAKFTISLKNW
ncbi:MAG TPA: tetratricopeptide repeat-containing sensor histidine kinase [Ignavibacteria bacterium]|nr:tetratricopeptide repeat-containing sensor histidine kinase [Ignavibacteria bacterium]HMQ98932.1 tetratricopeptide repeat-containing sensor histidine kinase [Ignavibacteria bacterium]